MKQHTTMILAATPALAGAAAFTSEDLIADFKTTVASFLAKAQHRPIKEWDTSKEAPADARRLQTVFAPDDKALKDAVAYWVRSSDDAEDEHGPIGEWDTSKVTDMSFLFCVRQGWMDDYADHYDDCVLTDDTFNEAIGAWDTSSVTSMELTFYNAAAFDADIGGWDTSKVTDMRYAFYGADVFNQDIGAWDVSQVTNIFATFYDAEAFNQDIGAWDTSKVTDMRYAFYDASTSTPMMFDQNISAWDTSKVTAMDHMFSNLGLQSCPSWAVAEARCGAT